MTTDILVLVLPDRSTSVLDGELGTVGLVGGALGIVVLVLQEASKTTLGGGNPQVGGSSIKDNLEGLRRSSNLDLSVELGVLVVIDVNVSGLSNSPRSSSTKVAVVKDDFAISRNGRLDVKAVVDKLSITDTLVHGDANESGGAGNGGGNKKEFLEKENR